MSLIFVNYIDQILGFWCDVFVFVFFDDLFIGFDCVFNVFGMFIYYSYVYQSFGC